MSTKKREVIWGGRIMGAKMRADKARLLVPLIAPRRKRDQFAWKTMAARPSLRQRSANA
jgi:hypothetical protein